ncbi:MAG: hypothetical protein B1H03_03425 [Planctomycetales bacterium 4484_113]|nr:MAG: hypothetical protein B1H03_03425 [Planctomycetales bacterium 4484_113]
MCTMSRQSKFLLEVSVAKLLFFSVLWAASLYSAHVAATLFPHESPIVFLLFLVINGVSLQRLAREPRTADMLLRLLFISDVVFAIYLTKFFFLSTGYVIVLFLGLIMFETLVVNALFGLITFVVSIGAVALLQWRAPAGYRSLQILLEQPDITFVALSMAATYFVAYLASRNTARLFSDAERLTGELADATVGSEIAKEELLKRNRHIGTLLKVSESLSSSLEMKDLFANFETALHESVEFDNLNLMVCDAAEGVFRNLMSHAEIFDLKDATVFPLDRGIAGVVYNKGRSYLTEDVSEDPNFVPYSPHARNIASLLAVPLYYRDEILGILTLDSRRRGNFTQEHLHFLESVAPLLAVAVNNVISFQAFKTASTRDRLTNLYNYFAFTRRFHELLEDSYRHDTPLTLLMIDIDDFKRVNDTYGHLMGNQVLAQFGELLSMFFRRSDLIARYGGEEFAVVLNRTPLDMGLVLSDNLRRQVEEMDFGAGGSSTVHISISVGVSSTADEGISFDSRPGRRAGDERYIANLEEIAERLISYADEALYASKSRGKNVVSVSQYAHYPRKDFTEYRAEADPSTFPRIEKKVLRLDSRM